MGQEHPNLASTELGCEVSSLILGFRVWRDSRERGEKCFYVKTQEEYLAASRDLSSEAPSYSAVMGPPPTLSRSCRNI